MEGGLLACIGAVAGSAVAHLGIAALIAVSPPELPRVSTIRLDAPVLVFAVGITAATWPG